jgi:transposase-like protein
VQIHRYGYGIGGFGRFSDYGLRFLVMVSEKAQDRYRALQFWEKYGLEATKEAFKVKRRTLYNWRKQLREGNEDIGSPMRSPGHREKDESGFGKRGLRRDQTIEGNASQSEQGEALSICEGFL